MKWEEKNREEGQKEIRGGEGGMEELKRRKEKVGIEAKGKREKNREL